MAGPTLAKIAEWCIVVDLCSRRLVIVVARM